MPVSVAPVQKKKYSKKTARLAKDEGEPGSSREQEEEAEPEIITRSLSPSELRDMRKDFSRHPGEHIITWLLRCWDNGAGSLELEGREAKQLASLSREGGIDKVIGKKPTSPQPLEATSVMCEGKVSLQGICCMSSKRVDYHEERYPVPEGISRAGDGLL